jgi:hypothetical protein
VRYTGDDVVATGGDGKLSGNVTARLSMLTQGLPSLQAITFGGQV